MAKSGHSEPGRLRSIMRPHREQIAQKMFLALGRLAFTPLILMVVFMARAQGQSGSEVAQRDSAATSAIQFEEIADRAGLHYVTATASTENKNQPQTMV